MKEVRIHVTQNQPIQAHKSIAFGTFTWGVKPHTTSVCMVPKHTRHPHSNSKPTGSWPSFPITTGNYSPDYKNFAKPVITEKAEQSPKLVANHGSWAEGGVVIVTTKSPRNYRTLGEAEGDLE